MAKIITKVLDDYPGSNSTTEQAWDFIQRNVSRRRSDPGFPSVAPPCCRRWTHRQQNLINTQFHNLLCENKQNFPCKDKVESNLQYRIVVVSDLNWLVFVTIKFWRPCMYLCACACVLCLPSRCSAAAGPAVRTGAATWWSWTAPSCSSPAPARMSRLPWETSQTAASARLRPPIGPFTMWWVVAFFGLGSLQSRV